MVGWAGEEEGECCPVAGEDRGSTQADEAGLHEDGITKGELDDVPEKAGVFLRHGFQAGVVGVGRRVVWHEEVEEDEDDIL